MKLRSISIFSIILLISTSINAQVLIKDSVNYVQPATLTTIPGALNFIAMGDWGRVGADHQKEVAAQMGKTSAEIKSQFTIATGDNFSSKRSDQSNRYPLWKYSYEDIYTAFSLQWDWYPVLGNS